MAIRHRPERRSPFQVYWNNPFSKRRESQDFSTLAEAEKFDSLVKHRLKHDRESFKANMEQEENAPESNKPTLEQCYYTYLKEKQFSKKSLAWSLDGMKTILLLIGGTCVDEIDKNMLGNVMNSLSARKVKPITVRNRMSALRAVLRWCVRKYLLTTCPQFPQLPPARHERFIPPTPDEIRTMLGVAPPHMQQVIILGSQLGARIGTSELFRLKWEDVELQRGVVRIQAAKKNPHEPWREVPLRGTLRALVQVWRDEDIQTGASSVINYHGKQISSVKTAW